MKVLSIAVHPDDETLGCGATLLKHAAQGSSLHWLLITSAHERKFSIEQIEKQRSQVMAVKNAYPFETLDWLKLPTTELEMLPLDDLIVAMRRVIDQVRPEIVFIPNRSDVHSDHRVIFQAVSAVLKSFYMQTFGVRKILACETISETDAAFSLPESVFLPNVYVDVSQTFERKLEIMNLYQTELHAGTMPRSLSAIRAQGRCRGATMGVEYAESFMLMREIV